MAIDIEILDAIVDVPSFWTSGVSAKRIVEKLHANPAEEVDLFVNSPGGSASAGITVASELARREPEVRVHVLGVAASAAAVVALGSGTDRLHMPAGTFVMLHMPLLWAVGNADQLRQDAELLDQYAEEIALLLHRGRLSDLSEPEILSLMGKNTWIGSAAMADAGRLDGEEAPAQARALRETVLDSLTGWTTSDTVNASVKGWREHVGPILQDDDRRLVSDIQAITEMLR